MQSERDEQIEAELLEEFLVESPLPLLKATPRTEGDRRFLYTEPSNESWDSEDERVLQKALAGSREYFLKFGNLDINHLTLFGLKMGIRSPHLYEIGKPIEVKIEPRILVKGEIYRGSGKSAEQANIFWSSLTEQQPAQTWYPSVGGHRPQKVEHSNGRKTVVAVRWINVGFAKEPQNTKVAPASIIPPDVFLKAVTAGYATDSVGMTGGAALRVQSHEGINHRRVGARFMKALGTDTCEHTAGMPTLAKLVGHFEHCEGMGATGARAAAEQFLGDVARSVKHQKSHDHAARIAA